MAASDQIWRVNRSPRFTALQMGEYMSADDGPRETILRNMKYERLAPTLLYDGVARAVASYLASPVRDSTPLANCRERLEAERDMSPNGRKRDNVQYALEALNAFERSTNVMELGGLQLSRAPMNRHPLMAEGVKISVQPIALIRAARPRGADLLGSLIIDFAVGQTARTDDARAKLTRAMTYTAVLLHEQVGQEAPADGCRASPAHCIVFHCHRGERVSAPSSYRTMMRDLQAACRIIRRSWDDIEPPASFDERFARYRD